MSTTKQQEKGRVLQSLPVQQLPVLPPMLDFFHTNNSELTNATDKSSHTKKIPQDWLNQNKITKEYVETIYSKELAVITCQEERKYFLEQELQKMKYHQKHIK
eukprot:14111059-Ditylum_brightwellii.AAC.1